MVSAKRTGHVTGLMNSLKPVKLKNTDPEQS